MLEEIKNLLEKLSPKERDVTVLLYGLGGRPMCPEEIATQYGVSKEMILQIADDVKKKYPELITLAQAEFVFNKNCTEVVRYIAGEDVFISCSAAVRIINELLSESSERDAEVIILRFGLKDFKNITLRKIGEMCGITGERVRQIENRAIAKIKSKIKGEIKLQEEIKRTKFAAIDKELLNINFFGTPEK